MNGAHAHLLLNHFPIIGSIFSTLLLFGGVLSKSENVKKAGLLFFIFTAIMTAPAFLTGDEAEETLKAVGQAPHELIEEHEEIAETGLWLTMAVGLLAMFAYFSIKKPIAKTFVYVVILAGVANCVLMTFVGNSGGDIRHTEIRSGSSVSSGEHEGD
ncbi:MAG: hypothetical protein U0X76_08020 [Bacteroidia bacterium]